MKAQSMTVFVVVTTVASALAWPGASGAQNPGKDVNRGSVHQPPAKQNSAVNSRRALVAFSKILTDALKKEQPTESDVKALRAEYEKLTRSDKAKANNLLAASIVNAKYPSPERPVVLLLDHF